MRTVRPVLVGSECAASYEGHAEQSKVIRRDVDRVHLLRQRTRCKIQSGTRVFVSREVLEHSSLLAPNVEPCGRPAARNSGGRRDGERNDALRMRKRKGFQQDRVHYGKDGRIRSDTEGQGSQRSRRECGSLRQGANRVSDILHEYQYLTRYTEMSS